MNTAPKYPLLEINLNKIFDNTKCLVNLCKEKEISISGVIKGVNADPQIIDALVDGGCKYLASSRIEQLISLKEKGIKKENMLIRMPMAREIKDVVQYIDITLNSELKTINLLEKECKKQNKEHKVILMMDLGDLREGFFNKNELIDTALYIENNLKYVKLYGIGTNLSCYGSIKPSYENLSYLCEIAEEIESKIGRKLDIISGGSTTSLPLVLDNKIPSKINNLRIGEALLIGRELIDYWGYDLEKIHKDTLILKAEIIEIKEKPSYPIGEMFLDAFGNKPNYEDKGIRKRAILAVGKQDFVNDRDLIPLDDGVEIVGSSSDHLIVDIQNSNINFQVGDIMSLGMFYPCALFLTSSKYVNKYYIHPEL
ncbi:ornithine racemase Orr [Paraclostridium ghonii]|uniref:Amino acid racemase n=1 Tax=Paraclostridium ghonii TaxID=29358 RepID=A0ABU0MZM6_9FIRM|nr:alanine/ornithine racemase family PLP-dependent enzyme [Paeniclostridium ghonii]MDQ0556365.1 putative amino acid racemase [Paeniclostridium ghonii]